MRPMDLPTLLRDGTLDAPTAALVWLLVEGGVPLVVSGPAPAASRAGLAAALLAFDPTRVWSFIDADVEPLTAERLTALLRGGVAFGVGVEAPDLEAVFERFGEMGLPQDGIRRMGLVLILDTTAAGPRCTSVHYLRPSERDARGHVQRRPPAVLAAWDGVTDALEDYAWAITPELGDRVDRSQADLEERRAERARFLVDLTLRPTAGSVAERVRDQLASEPERRPAPPRDPAKPSPFRGGLLDADEHAH